MPSHALCECACDAREPEVERVKMKAGLLSKSYEESSKTGVHVHWYPKLFTQVCNVSHRVHHTMGILFCLAPS